MNDRPNVHFLKTPLACYMGDSSLYAMRPSMRQQWRVIKRIKTS